MLLFSQTAQNIVKLLISCHVWRLLLMAQECESSLQPGCKDQDLLPRISWTILSKAHSTVTFFSPINQRGEIYQRTVVRDRWAEGWEGQQRFFTGPLHHSRSLTFSPLWIGLLLTGQAFNLFHTLGGKKTSQHLDFAHKIMYWLLKHWCTGFLAHI